MARTIETVSDIEFKVYTNPEIHARLRVAELSGEKWIHLHDLEDCVRAKRAEPLGCFPYELAQSVTDKNLRFSTQYSKYYAVPIVNADGAAEALDAAIRKKMCSPERGNLLLDWILNEIFAAPHMEEETVPEREGTVDSDDLILKNIQTFACPWDHSLTVQGGQINGVPYVRFSHIMNLMKLVNTGGTTYYKNKLNHSGIKLVLPRENATYKVWAANKEAVMLFLDSYRQGAKSANRTRLIPIVKTFLLESVFPTLERSASDVPQDCTTSLPIAVPQKTGLCDNSFSLQDFSGPSGHVSGISVNGKGWILCSDLERLFKFSPKTSAIINLFNRQGTLSDQERTNFKKFTVPTRYHNSFGHLCFRNIPRAFINQTGLEILLKKRPSVSHVAAKWLFDEVFPALESKDVADGNGTQTTLAMAAALAEIEQTTGEIVQGQKTDSCQDKITLTKDELQAMLDKATKDAIECAQKPKKRLSLWQRIFA